TLCPLQLRAVVVELEHAHRAGRGGVEAQTAEHALVEVLLVQDEVAALLAVDVDGTDLGQLVRDLRLLRGRVGDLDADERGVGSHAGTSSFSRIIIGMSSMRSATAIPASARRAIFSLAVSSLPSTMVPAWPKLMPGISSMKRPAMKATIGSRESFSVT